MKGRYTGEIVLQPLGLCYCCGAQATRRIAISGSLHLQVCDVCEIEIERQTGRYRRDGWQFRKDIEMDIVCKTHDKVLLSTGIAVDKNMKDVYQDA